MRASLRWIEHEIVWASNFDRLSAIYITVPIDISVSATKKVNSFAFFDLVAEER